MEVFIILLLTSFCYGDESHFIGSSGVFFQPLENVYIHDTNYILVYQIIKPEELPQAPSVKSSSRNVNVRSKRWADHGLLPFIGWINQKLTGVATVSDLDDIKVQSSELSDYVTKLRDLTKKNTVGLSHLIGDITTIKKGFEINSNLFSNALKEISAFNRRVGKAEQTLNTDIHELSSYVKNTMLYVTQRQDLDYYWLDYQLGLSTCRSELIPENYISKETLLMNISSVMKRLDSSPFTLSIPTSDVDWYYIFRMTFCKETTDGVLLMISIPLRRKSLTSLKIEKLIPIPIRINGNTFVIADLQESLVISNLNTVSIIKSVQKNCMSDNNLDLSNCLIKVDQNEVFSSNSCLSVIRSGQSIRDYKSKCKLKQHTGKSFNWIQLNSTHWTYSGPETTIKIQCYDSLNTTVLVIGGEHNSNILSIPCNCWTEDGLVTSATSFDSCKMNLKFINLNLFSYHYIPYDDLKITPLRLDSSFEFTSDLLKNRSGLNMYNYSMDLINMEKLLKSIDRTVPSIAWSSPYHSVWYYVWICLVGAVVLITVCIVSPLLKRIISGSVLFHQLPIVKSEGVPEWVEVSYDLILFLILLTGLIIIIVLIKRILTRTACHNFSVTGLKGYEGPHCDIIIIDGASSVSIGLKRLPNLGFTYLTNSSIGKITASGGILEVSGFTDLEDLSGSRIAINGVYDVNNSIFLKSCSAVVKIPCTY